MPRIRTIKPEFFGDEKLAPMAVIDRFVFLGLVSAADDAGRLVDNVKAIDGFIFPESEDSSRESLMRLSGNGRILRYTSASGQPIIQLVNWKKHQKIQHPSKYVLPAPPRASSRNAHEDLPKSSGLDLNHHTNDHGPTTLDHGPPTNDLRPSSSAVSTTNGSSSSIAGVIGGEPADAAIVLSRAANRGITEKWGEQPNPIRADAGTSIEAVEMLRAEGVPIAYARDAMYTWCKTDGQTRDGRPPQSLKYLAKVIIPRWKASREHALATTSDAQLLDDGATGTPATGAVDNRPDWQLSDRERFERAGRKLQAEERSAKAAGVSNG